jgi:hypothetical protein
MKDVTITLEPDGVVATGLLSSTPTKTRGESVELELLYEGNLATQYEDGTEYSDDQLYGDPVAHYGRMADRLSFVNAIYTGFSHDGVPWVDERLPDRAPVSSQIVRVKPGDGINDIDSFWGVIVSGEDNSRPPQSSRRVTVELVYLADGDRYSTRDDLRADIGPNAL